MVATSKRYVKRAELMTTIDATLKAYRKIRVEYPSNVEQHFLVKGWGKKEKPSHEIKWKEGL